ncbi:MAG: rRNA (uracil1939-C5)-methyltransferase, partial [Candidatus Hydrogenedentes bacterium]|nr:rRNA (uracil1939-C5)-methyltransferase [Candidatus Hydrogenedentota bacterium]
PAIIEELHIPDGEGIRKLYFRVSPFSFLQTNSLGAERLYGLVREWARETAPAVLYDLYGGAGGMAFACSDLVEQVWSVEIVEDATRDGITNAAANGIGNVTFVNAKVKNYLRELILGSGMPPDSAAIVDPPRAGLHPKALRRLVELAPRDVLYISCNPKMLAQEMPQLLEVYRLESLRAVDLFPHTRHVEVLARFTFPAF